MNKKIIKSFNGKFKNLPITVMNGYHIQNYENQKFNIKNILSDKIKIGYFGIIDDNSKSYRDINVIYDKVKNDKDVKDNFIFYFYGPIKIKKKEIINFNNFKFNDSVNHNEAMTLMKEMDYLLVLHTERITASEVLTGKLFDYIYASKPINGPPHTADACASLLDGRLLVQPQERDRDVTVEQAEELLDRRSGDEDHPRILQAFNWPITDWLHLPEVIFFRRQSLSSLELLELTMKETELLGKVHL